MRKEYYGDVLTVRAAEDTIRATGKYTKGLFSRGQKKEYPVQGEDFASKVVVEYYEVYPKIDINQRRPFWDAVFTTSDWLWGDTPIVEVWFRYNYNKNTAVVVVRGGHGTLELLKEGIPGLADALKVVEEAGKGRSNGNGDMPKAKAASKSG